MITAHADVVELAAAAVAVGGAGAPSRGRDRSTSYKSIEDRAVDEAVAQQEQAGLTVLTDGEMRRLSFQSQMVQAVEGFGEWDLGAFLWGDWHGDDEIGDWRRERPKELAVGTAADGGRYRRRVRLSAFPHGTHPKVTLPSPGLFANFWSPGARASAASLEGFLEDVTDPARGSGRARRVRGQLHPARCTALSLAARTRDARVLRSAGLERAAMARSGRRLGQPGDGRHRRRDLRPAPVPRQPGSRWLVSGDYGPIAEPIFQRTAAHRLLLEYDDARSGGFEPLQHVPDDKMVVLGLITTKRGELENADELVAHRGGEPLRRPRALGIEPAMRLRDIDHREQADAGAAGREAPAGLRRRRKSLGLKTLLFGRDRTCRCGCDPSDPILRLQRSAPAVAGQIR